jgi:hypothetical protein
MLRFKEDPENVFIPVWEFMQCFGLNEQQFRQEAGSGRLRVRGIRRGNNVWTDLNISGKDAVEWLAKYRMSN